MTSDSLSRTAARNGVRVIATEMIRKPVKDAVKDALREEGVAGSHRGSEQGHGKQHEQRSSGKQRKSGQKSGESQESGGGRSKLLVATLLAGIVGLTYLARRRMQSGQKSWSGPAPESVAREGGKDGYASEGEMQTAEGAGESEDVSHSTSEQ